jgi:DNA-binding NtrC family response regulator
MTGLSEPIYSNPNHNPMSVVQQAPPPANEPGYGSRAERLNVGTVLLADDDPSSRSVLERWLSMSGHSVQSFPTSEALLGGLRGFYADAVCINLERGAFGGIDTVRAVRRVHASIPIIFLTSHTAQHALATAVREGATECVIKPTDQHYMAKTVADSVEKFRLRMRIQELERSGPGALGDVTAYLSEVLEERPMKLDELEQRAIVAAMKRTGGNVTQAMRELGIGRTTLYRKLKKYGMR